MPSEPPANPSDTAYIPRPEWYFLWTFQLLKYFPGQLEGVAILGLGLVIFVGLFGLPFFDRGPKRHPRQPPIATIAMILIVAGMVFLSIQAVVTTPVRGGGPIIGGTKAEQIQAGGELFVENCADCHGADGEGGEIKDKPGETHAPSTPTISSSRHFDDTIFQIISYGQPGEGMQAFGPAYGGQLNDQEIRAIIAFIRSWDVPVEETDSQHSGGLPDLAKIENPSFAKDVKPILDKRCLNCHGKRVKGGYRVDDYNNVMTSGDHAPVIVAGDAANSTLAKMLHGVKTPAGGQMPPSRPLQPAADRSDRAVDQPGSAEQLTRTRFKVTSLREIIWAVAL